MLALLRDEDGADRVQNLLDDADVPKFAHAVNLCEVFYDALKSTDVTGAEVSMAALRDEGIVERNDMDAAFWRDVATLIAQQRAAGHRLALGDAFGVALARREDADFVTADRAELESMQAAGIARITFIR
jgi:PIN domain nuclease of toxin-antitoxin system